MPLDDDAARLSVLAVACLDAARAVDLAARVQSLPAGHRSPMERRLDARAVHLGGRLSHDMEESA